MRTAVIGLGRMGLRHLLVVRDLGLEIVGVSDMHADARARAKDDYALSEEAVFEDGKRMIETLRPQLVVVATTAPSHADYVCHAAEHGAEVVLCEKPMAVSLAECDRMIEACLASGTRLAVNHQMRFMEQYTSPKEVIHSPAFGGLGSVSVVAGNFGIAMNGSHYFEMFRYVTDEAPVKVAAWFSEGNLANPRGAQFEDKAGCVRLETASGKRFYMDASMDQGHGMHVTYAGPYGRLCVDELAGKLTLVVREEQHRAQPTTRYGMPWIESATEIAPADAVLPTCAVLAAVLAGEDYPTGDIGKMAVEILVAAYVSDENGGRVVDLREGSLPRDRTFPWA